MQLPNDRGYGPNIDSPAAMSSSRKLPTHRHLDGHANPQVSFREVGHVPHTHGAPHPLAVMHLRHLMSQMGFWVILLLGTQGWFAWRIGMLASDYLLGGPIIYFAIMLVLMLLLDCAVWLHRRGNLIDAFLLPFAMLFLMAALPILFLSMK